MSWLKTHLVLTISICPNSKKYFLFWRVILRLKKNLNILPWKKYSDAFLPFSSTDKLWKKRRAVQRSGCLTRSMSMVSKSMPSLRSSIRPSDDIITSSTMGSSSSSISPVPRRLQGRAVNRLWRRRKKKKDFPQASSCARVLHSMLQIGPELGVVHGSFLLLTCLVLLSLRQHPRHLGTGVGGRRRRKKKKNSTRAHQLAEVLIHVWRFIQSIHNCSGGSWPGACEKPGWVSQLVSHRPCRTRTWQTAKRENFKSGLPQNEQHMTAGRENIPVNSVLTFLGSYSGSWSHSERISDPANWKIRLETGQARLAKPCRMQGGYT